MIIEFASVPTLLIILIVLVKSMTCTIVALTMTSQLCSHIYNTLDLATSRMTCTTYSKVHYVPIPRGNSPDI